MSRKNITYRPDQSLRSARRHRLRLDAAGVDEPEGDLAAEPGRRTTPSARSPRTRRRHHVRGRAPASITRHSSKHEPGTVAICSSRCSRHSSSGSASGGDRISASQQPPRAARRVTRSMACARAYTTNWATVLHRRQQQLALLPPHGCSGERVQAAQDPGDLGRAAWRSAHANRLPTALGISTAAWSLGASTWRDRENAQASEPASPRAVVRRRYA